MQTSAQLAVALPVAALLSSALLLHLTTVTQDASHTGASSPTLLPGVPHTSAAPPPPARVSPPAPPARQPPRPPRGDCRWDFPVSPGRPLDFFAQTLLELLTLVVTAFNSANVSHYVRRGLLLGVYRHRGQIPFLDNDGDLSIAQQDYDRAIQLLKGTLDPSRYTLKAYKATPPFYQLCRREVYKRCHKYHQKFNMMYFLYPWQLDLNPDMPVPTCQCRYYNLTVNCPLDTEGRLERLYGRSFRTHPMCRMRPDLCYTQTSMAANLSWSQVKDTSHDPFGLNGSALSDLDLIHLHVHPFRRLATQQNYCTHPVPDFPGFHTPAKWNRPFIKQHWGSGAEEPPAPAPQ
eukprot:EG_transcript_14801